MPVQMDHMFVREAYRVWHGAAHLDDARQAPVNYSHWDGWSQGASTDNRFKPDSISPGLNVGGWFDAGDFDIQTPLAAANRAVIDRYLGRVRSAHDETTVDQQAHYTEIHLPDGKPDVLQQIEAWRIAARRSSQCYRICHSGHQRIAPVPIPPLGRCRNQDRRYCGQRRRPHGVHQPYTCPQLRNCCRTSCLSTCFACPQPLRFASEALRIAEFIWKDEHNRKAGKEGRNPRRLSTASSSSPPLNATLPLELWRATGNAMYKAR